MEYTFETLKKKTVAQLREIAATLEHEAVKGYTQLNKEHLLDAVCVALNLDKHEHHEIVGVDKAAIKAQIRKLKNQRDEGLQTRNKANHKYILREIHHLKRKLHKSTV